MQKRIWVDKGQIGETAIVAATLNSLETDVAAALLQVSADPSMMFSGAVIRDPSGTPVSAGIVWPDGATGVYSGTASTAFPGAVDAYTVTRTGSPVLTFTQPAVTRSATGAVTNRPAITLT